MWYEKQFRDSGNLTTLLQAIRQIATFPIRIMEVCGGQTYALSRISNRRITPRHGTNDSPGRDARYVSPMKIPYRKLSK